MISCIISYFKITGIIGSLLILFFKDKILSLARIKHKPEKYNISNSIKDDSSKDNSSVTTMNINNQKVFVDIITSRAVARLAEYSFDYDAQKQAHDWIKYLKVNSGYDNNYERSEEYLHHDYRP